MYAYRRKGRVRHNYFKNSDICKIHMLNSDCLRLIFAKLPFRGKLIASRVCKRWQTIISEMFCKFTYLALQICPHISFKKFNMVFDLVAANVKEISLHFHVNCSIYESVMSLIGIHCENLEIMRLSNIDMNFDRVLCLINNCPQIKCLTLSSCKGLTDENLSYIFNQERCLLENITINNSHEFNGICLSSIRSPVKSLSFINCGELKPKYLALGMQHLTDTLCSLTVRCCSSLFDLDFNQISKLVPRLQHLTLITSTEPPLPQTIIVNFAELQTLDLSFNVWVSDVVINSVVNNCKQLKIFRLRDLLPGHLINEECISELGRLTNLEELDISGNFYVNDQSLKRFSEKCSSSKIKKFIGQKCTFGDEGAADIMSSCTKLEYFDVSYTSIGVQTLVAAVNCVSKRQRDLPLTLKVIGSSELRRQNKCHQYYHPLLNVVKSKISKRRKDRITGTSSCIHQCHSRDSEEYDSDYSSSGYPYGLDSCDDSQLSIERCTT